MQPIENLLQTSMEQIRNMVDVNTVVGDPIFTTNETMILPVSKVCLGFLVGGGEYGNMSSSKRCSDEACNHGTYPFGGGTTVGMCITPMAFLAVDDGNVRVLPANQKSTSDRLVDIIPQAVKSIEKFVQAGINCKKNNSAQAANAQEQTQNAQAQSVNAQQQAHNTESQTVGSETTKAQAEAYAASFANEQMSE